MNILFTICGRAGSKGFKNKNLKKMNGVPLFYYSLAIIKLFSTHHPDYRIVTALNTDSVELKAMASNQIFVEDIRIIDRKYALAGDKVAKVDVIKDTFLEVLEDNKFDVVVDLDLTSPLRGVEDVEKAIDEFMSNENYDLVFSVVPARRSPYFNMVEKKDGYYRKICASNYVARQEAPVSYELNASIYVYNPEFLRGEIKNTILDNRCGISVMRDYLVLDIDSEEDFVMMEFLHNYYCEHDPTIKEVYDVCKTICDK